MALKEATASFKKGDMAATEYHESVLKHAFGSKLPEMLPKLLKALPPDRAAALKAVTEVLRIKYLQRSREIYVGRRTCTPKAKLRVCPPALPTTLSFNGHMA